MSTHAAAGHLALPAWATALRTRLWLVALVGPGCWLLLLVLHASQHRSAARDSSVLDLVRAARLDLAAGLADAAGAEGTGALENRARAVAGIARAIQAFDEFALMGGAADGSDLAGATESVRGRVAEWGPAADPRPGRAALADFRRLADRAEVVDRREQTRFAARAERRARVFTGTAVATGVLQAVVLGILYLGELGARRDLQSRRRAAGEEPAPVELLRAVVEGSSDAIFVKDRGGKYLLFNEAAARLVGRPVAEVLGRDDTALFDPAGARVVMDRDREVIQTGRADTQDEVLTAGGTTRTYLATKLPYRDAGGTVAGVIGFSRDVTHLRDAEQQLRAERDQFTKFVDTVPVVICSFQHRADGTACFPYASPRIEGVFGLTPDQLARDAAPVFERTHPDDLSRILASIAESARTLTEWHDEFRFRHPSRGERWVEGRSAPVPQADGSVVWYGYVVDATDRKRAEAAVFDSEARFRGLVFSAMDAVVSIDAGGRIILFNRAAERMFEVPSGEVLGGPLDRLLPARYRPNHAALIEEFGRTGVTSRAMGALGAVVGRRSDGREFPIEASISQADTGGGKVFTAILRDVTERLAAEQSRARLAAIVESSDDAIISKSLDGVVVTWNAGAERLFGYPADVAVGCPITVLIPPDRLGEEDAILARVRAGERIKHFDTVRVTRDGRRVEVSLTVSPIRDGRGVVVGASKIVRDITDRVRARQRLEIQHAVVRILASADSLADAAPALLRAVCESADWVAGDIWLVDETTDTLVLLDVWVGDRERRDEFIAVSRRTAFGSGVGLPGQVWADGAWRWVPDVTRDEHFVRKAAAEAVGLRGAFAFPIRSLGATVGVVEFFFDDTRPPDEELLRVFDNLGTQIGQFAERARARDALRESEGRFRATFEQAAVGIAHVAPDGRFLRANERYAELSGYTVGELLDGLTPLTITHPDDQPRDAEGVARLLAGETESYAAEKRFVRKDGAAVWVQVTVSVRRDDAGQPLHLIGIAQDISARKQAESALRESEERFRNVFEHAPTGIGITDPAGRFLQCNPAYCRLLGLSEEELRAADLATLIHPEDRVENLTRLRRLAAGEISGYEIENRFVHKSGASVWVFKQVSALWDDAGRVTGLMALVTDVTERRRAGEALRESEGRLRLFIEHAPAALAMFDRDMRYLVASRRWVADYRLREDDLVGRSHYDLFPEIPAEWRAVHARALAGEVVRADRDTFRHADGTVQWLRWEVRPWHDAAGAVGGIVMFADDITAAVRAEEALRESEVRFRNVFEHAVTGIAVADRTGRFVRCNPAFCRIVGRAENELRGTEFSALVHPEDRAENLAGNLRVMTAECPNFEIENRYVHRSGETVYVHKFISALPDETGVPEYYMALVTDVTERRRAEQAIRESETRFRTLIEFLPDAVFLNVNGRVAFCNPACVRLFGAAGPDDLIGKTPFDLHPPEWHDLIRERIARQLEADEQAPGIEEEVLRLDGGRIPVYVTALPIIDGGSRALLVTLHDLTERKRVEMQLRHQEMMLREAAELAHVGGWGFDPATGQGDWTPETARIHGLEPSPAATVAEGLSFFDGTDRDRVEAAVRAAVSDGTPYDLELQLTAADGTRKWVRTICRPILDNGRVVRVRGSLQDITDRKRAETEIRELNADLERRVRERTTELEYANKELEAFSYSVSHDLRGPIRHITGFTGIALEAGEAELPAETRGHLLLVMKAAHRMGLLVDDLLVFSRLGRQPVRRQPVDTRRLVQECLAEAVSASDARRVEVRVGELPPCDADPGLLRQVWLNLLANAVKYSRPRNPAVVEVGTVSTPDGPAYLVRDNGVGFDTRYAHKLFGVFQRLHRADEFEGTGIGLALVQRIVGRHGGRVWAESELQKGATFYFTLGRID